jgi:hypothetical protein
MYNDTLLAVNPRSESAQWITARSFFENFSVSTPRSDALRGVATPRSESLRGVTYICELLCEFAEWDWLMKKTEGRKSRATVPLTPFNDLHVAYYI